MDDFELDDPSERRGARRRPARPLPADPVSPPALSVSNPGPPSPTHDVLGANFRIADTAEVFVGDEFGLLGTSAPGEGPDREPGGRGVRGAVVVVVLAAVLLVGGLAAYGLTRGGSEAAPRSPDPTPSQRAGGAPTIDPSRVENLLDAVVFVDVPGTSSDSIDSKKHPTNFHSSNMLDGNPDTAWRFDGDQTGAEITLTWDAPVTIARVGLVNGYAKLDPDGKTDRYAEERRITLVTWFVDGKPLFPQILSDGVRSMQTLPYAEPVSGTTLTLRIDETSEQGGRDYTAISDLLVEGVPE
jgi:hypothetical protein